MELTFVNMLTVDKRKALDKDNHLLLLLIIIIEVALTLFISTVEIVDMSYKSEAQD